MAKVTFEKWDDPTTARAFGGTFEYLFRVYAGRRRVGVIEKSIGAYEYNDRGKLVRPVMFRFVPDYDLISQCEDKWELVRTGKNITECKAQVRELFA